VNNVYFKSVFVMIRFQSYMCQQIPSARNIEILIDTLYNFVPMMRNPTNIEPVILKTPTNEIDNVYAIEYVMRDFLADNKPRYIDFKYFTPLERLNKGNLNTHIWIDHMSKSYPRVLVLMDRGSVTPTYNIHKFCELTRDDQ
jgi:hypothetical protein